MMDEHPTLIGNLIGVVMVGIGRNGLVALYRGTGRGVEAQRIEDATEAAMHANSRYLRYRPGVDDLQGVIDDMLALANDRESLRGLRWEMFAQAVTWAPFLNLHTAVYGPGEFYEEWVGRMERDLVRYPAEAEMFAAYRYGMLVTPESLEHPGLLARLLSLSLGGQRSPGSFSVLLSALADR
jgi:hypothetical protein